MDQLDTSAFQALVTKSGYEKTASEVGCHLSLSQFEWTDPKGEVKRAASHYCQVMVLGSAMS